MAAAQEENGINQFDNTVKPHMQQAKSVPAHRFPMIFLSARQASNVLPASLSPSSPSSSSARHNVVVNKLASMQPQRIHQDAVFVSFPAATSHNSISTFSNGGSFNTAVSFAGKQAVTIPVPATSELISVSRPGPAPGGNEKIYSLGTGTMLCFSKLASPVTVPVVRMEKPLASKNGALKPTKSFTQSITASNIVPSKVTRNGVTPNASSGGSKDTLSRYNTAPGWRRLIRNKVIVYVSPSNAVLHNFEQVKEYLLSSGTCKCGLPCPFHPEGFFQFDTQVPNSVMDAKGSPTKSCSHLQALATGSELDKRFQSDATLHRKGLGNAHGAYQKKDSSILLKTPPWRKHVASTISSTFLTSCTSSPVAATTVSNVFSVGSNGRGRDHTRPAKPPQLIQNSANVTLNPCNEQSLAGHDTPRKVMPLVHLPTALDGVSPAAERTASGADDVSMPLEDKKPTFRDDPTGYLNQQTAILNNSISTLHSPERRSPLSSVSKEQHQSGPVLGTNASNKNRPADSFASTSKVNDQAPKDEERPMRHHRLVSRIMPLMRAQQLPSEVFPQPSSAISTGMVEIKVGNKMSAAGGPPTISRITFEQAAAGDGRTMAPGVRIATNERSRSSVLAKSAPGRPKLKEQCSSAKLAKLSLVAAAGPSGGGIFRHLFPTSVTTAAVAAKTSLPPITSSANMFVPTQSSHSLINPGGAQIVVIDGLQHSAVSQGGGTDVGRFKVAGLFAGRQQQPVATICNSLIRAKTTATPTTATTTLPAMILNGGNIIHLASGLTSSSAQMFSTIGGLLAGEAGGSVAQNSRRTTTQYASGTAAGAKSLLTIANDASGTALGYTTGSTMFINHPTTTITSNSVTTTTATHAGFADVSQHFTPSSFCTPVQNAGFTKPLVPVSVTSNGIDSTVQYSQYGVCQGATTLDSAKTKRQKGTLNGFGGNGTTNSLVIAASPMAFGCQPQHQALQAPHTATHAMQLQGPFVQIATPYGGLQNIQFSSRLSGISVVPVSKSSDQTVGQLVVPLVGKNGASLHAPLHPTHLQQSQHPQQHQAYNMLGQTIFLPTGNMVMTSDVATSAATLLQIPASTSLAASSSPALLGEQTGLVLRQAKPSGFISTMGHQPSFLISSNGGGSKHDSTRNGSHNTDDRALQLPVRSSILAAGGNTSLSIVAAQPLAMSPSRAITVTQSVPAIDFVNSSTSGNSIERRGLPSSSLGKPSAQVPKLVNSNSTPDRHSILLHPDTTFSSQLHSLEGKKSEPRISRSNPVTRKSAADGLHSFEYPMPMVQCVSSSEPAVNAGAAAPSGGTPCNERQEKSWHGAAAQGTVRQPCAAAHQAAVPNLSEYHKCSRPLGGGAKETELCETTVDPPASTAHRVVGAGRADSSVSEPTVAGSLQPAKHTLPKQPEHPYEQKGPNASLKCRKRRLLAEETGGVADAGSDRYVGPGTSVTSAFRAGDLVWGPVRGFPAWPGKVVPAPSASSAAGLVRKQHAYPSRTSSDATQPPQDGCVWVRWFGTGRTNAERVAVGTLQSLSDGLEAHHRAQKDARKSRKLNAQLEHAIQQAMQELDATQTAGGHARRGPAGSGQRPQHSTRHGSFKGK